MTQHKIVVKIGILENDINPHSFHVGIWLETCSVCLLPAADEVVGR